MISTLPVLTVVIFGFLWFLTVRLARMGKIDSTQKRWMAQLFVVLLIWGCVVATLSISGVFTTEWFVRSFPGYWLPFIPVVIALTLITFVAPLRDGIRTLVDETPDHWLTGIHLLRMLAIGTLVKASAGIFPVKFALYIGIPDLIFGLSAIPITLLILRGRMHDNLLILWNLVGAFVILMPLLGLMHILMREILFTELFVFPMVLAPTLVVPTLVMMNLMVVWRLFEIKLIHRD
ncbi:MAG: hypothetical protein ABFS39_14925 [Pseudomonadota bacterium]